MFFFRSCLLVIVSVNGALGMCYSCVCCVTIPFISARQSMPFGVCVCAIAGVAQEEGQQHSSFSHLVCSPPPSICDAHPSLLSREGFTSPSRPWSHYRYCRGSIGGLPPAREGEEAVALAAAAAETTTASVPSADVYIWGWG